MQVTNMSKPDFNSENTAIDLYDAFTHYLDEGKYTNAREVIAKTIDMEFFGEAHFLLSPFCALVRITNVVTLSS